MLSSSPPFHPATAILEARVTFLERRLGTVSTQLAQLAEHHRIVQATVQPVTHQASISWRGAGPRRPSQTGKLVRCFHCQGGSAP